MQLLETLEKIAQQLQTLQTQMLDRRIAPNKEILYPESFINMQDYLSIKKHDLRQLQNALKEVGLSSLHYAHRHLHFTLDRELTIIRALLQQTPISEPPTLSPERSYEILQQRSHFLKSDSPYSAIMLTLPTESITDPDFEKMLSHSSISIVRINTAHDTPEVWRQMAAMIQRINATKRKERPIRIYVDLAGPKIRTAPIRHTSITFKVCSTNIRRLFLIPASQGNTRIEHQNETSEAIAYIAVDDTFYQAVAKADFVEFNDHDRKPRYYKIVTYSKHICELECGKKVRIMPKTELSIQTGKKEFITTHPTAFQTAPEEIRLFMGDLVLLCDESTPGHLVEAKSYRAIIGCTMAQTIFPKVSVGDRIFIDDGKIALRVLEPHEGGLLAQVIDTKPTGTIIKEHKGINFPDTLIDIPALTQEDRENFAKVRDFADIIGLSFAQNAQDVRDLKALISTKDHQGIVIKVETKEGVRNLPDMLYELMDHKDSAVMLARGDLAVEVGFENLPRIQEQIIDLCEAAHTPVIYATQILENMMKKSLPSRAEVIDASIAQRTECVMLNKGPFTYRAITTLEKILTSMKKLFFKGEPLLSRTDDWSGFRERLMQSEKKEKE